MLLQAYARHPQHGARRLEFATYHSRNSGGMSETSQWKLLIHYCLHPCVAFLPVGRRVVFGVQSKGKLCLLICIAAGHLVSGVPRSRYVHRCSGRHWPILDTVLLATSSSSILVQQGRVCVVKPPPLALAHRIWPGYEEDVVLVTIEIRVRLCSMVRVHTYRGTVPYEHPERPDTAAVYCRRPITHAPDTVFRS